MVFSAFNSFQRPKNPPSLAVALEKSPFPRPPMAPVSDLLTVGRHRAAEPQEIHQGALLRRTLHRREGFEDTEVRMVAGAVEQLQGTWRDRIDKMEI